MFLVYAPENKEKAFLTWATVNFAANIENSRWYDLYYKGVIGGFSAFYQVMPLYEKIDEYRGNETREIRFYPIKLSDNEFENFKNHLEEVCDKSYPYRFFTNNCAHGIYQLLFDSLENIPEPTQSLLSPLDVVAILHQENRLLDPFLMPPLKENIQKISDAEHAELEFMEWQNRSGKIGFDSDREQKLANLRHLISARSVETIEMFVPYQKWIEPHRYNRIEVSALYNEGKYSTLVSYRPILHDQTDNHYFYSSTNTFEILSTSIQFHVDRVSLQSLDFVNMRLMPIHDKWFRHWSYVFYAGYKDNKFVGKIGIGKSIYLLEKQKIALEFILTDQQRNEKNYIGFETQLIKHTIGKIRYGILYEHLYENFSNENIRLLNPWVAIDINKSFGVYLESNYSNKSPFYGKLALRHYF